MTVRAANLGRSFLFAYLENQRANAYDQNADLDQIGICHHKQHLLFQEVPTACYLPAAPRPDGAFFILSSKKRIVNKKPPGWAAFLYAQKAVFPFLVFLFRDRPLLLQQEKLTNLIV